MLFTVCLRLWQLIIVPMLPIPCSQAINIGYSCRLLWDEKESGERMWVHRVDLREVR